MAGRLRKGEPHIHFSFQSVTALLSPPIARAGCNFWEQPVPPLTKTNYLDTYSSPLYTINFRLPQPPGPPPSSLYMPSCPLQKRLRSTPCAPLSPLCLPL